MRTRRTDRRWLAAAGFVSLLLATVNTTWAADKSCPPKPLAAVDLVIDGAALIPVTVKGQPAWMTLQTDASVTLIHQDITNTWQLPTRPLGKDYFQLSLGGRHITQMTSFEPLAIGALRIPRNDFFIDPFPNQSLLILGRPVIGTLAMDLLWRYDFELDLARRKLTFFSQSSCGGKVVYWADHYGRIPMDLTATGNIYFTVEIDGVKLETSIATSVDGSAMGVGVARRLNPPADASSASAPGPAPGDVLTKVIKLASGNLVIPDKIQLLSEPRSCQLSSEGRPDGALSYDGCFGRYPLALGRNSLQKLHLYFATKEKMIYFTAADVQ